MKPITTFILGAGLALASAQAAMASCAATLEQKAELWLEPHDTRAAMLEPDCYAWQLFVALSWPGDPATAAPDTAKALGDPGPATWELWRNVRPGSSGAVFRVDGQDPGPWLSGAPVELTRAPGDLDPLPLQLMPPGGAMAEFDPGDAHANETRMNRETYEFVRSLGLFSREGIAAVFDGGTETLDFPVEAKEVKARWRKIEDSEKQRYHWVELINPDSSRTTFGLTALHITTKDLPNWFWATFEHIDNEKSELHGGFAGHPGWLDPSVDAYTCPDAPRGCKASPAVVAGTKWENYVLRGTQIDFIDSRGRPTILANSVIEATFQDSSSCITCHARAAFGAGGWFNAIFKSRTPLSGDVGMPDPAWFFQGGNGAMFRTQSDFVWALNRACSVSTSNSCF